MLTKGMMGMYDVIVVGGSYAGISAALQVARARRRVLVLDAGLRRNRVASHAHGFLGQDGRDPAEIVATARAELLAYPTVTWIDGTATQVQLTDAGDVHRAMLRAGLHHRCRCAVQAAWRQAALLQRVFSETTAVKPDEPLVAARRQSDG